MGMQAAPAAKGLAGVVIGETWKSKVDGEHGRLQYVGYPIEEVAENATFEEVVYLLWNNRLPTRTELDAFIAALVADRALGPEIITLMKGLPASAHPMAVLRTVVSALGAFDAEAEDTSPEANLVKLRHLTAALPTIVAGWDRIREGKEPLAPNPNLGHAANFLYMLRGEVPNETEIDAIDTYLVLLADHGMNASTFSSRVTTATLSDVYSAVTSAIGTLKGPAHGGANEKAMEQFVEIGSLDQVDAWFDEAMASGRRIMGIGHRVYRVEDPRAAIFRANSEALVEASGETRWFAIARALEDKARSDPYFIERNLYANVDYYSAIVFSQLGIPVDLYTPIFAMSRIAGWAAHIMEQWANNRLIRPRAEYVGPVDQKWVPIDARG